MAGASRRREALGSVNSSALTEEEKRVNRKGRGSVTEPVHSRRLLLLGYRSSSFGESCCATVEDGERGDEGRGGGSDGDFLVLAPVLPVQSPGRGGKGNCGGDSVRRLNMGTTIPMSVTKKGRRPDLFGSERERESVFFSVGGCCKARSL